MSLCLDCGLCCDGTLFHSATLVGDEEARLTGRVRIADGKLQQPCVVLAADRKCGVYEDRPYACRQFRCSVLRALEKGNVTDEEANGIIQDVLAQRRALAVFLGVTEREALVVARGRTDLNDEGKALLEALGRSVTLLQFISA